MIAGHPRMGIGASAARWRHLASITLSAAADCLDSLRPSCHCGSLSICMSLDRYKTLTNGQSMTGEDESRQNVVLNTPTFREDSRINKSETLT